MRLFNLTYNELVKQFKKPSIKIIFSLILISSILLPMIVSKVPADRYAAHNLESSKFLLEQANQTVEFYKQDKTQKGKIQLKYAEIDKEYTQLFVDYEIAIDDWRRKEANEFKSAYFNLAAIEFVLEGYEQNTVMENLREGDPNLVASYYEMTLAKKKEIEAQYTLAKDKYKNIIDTNNYMGHTEEEIKRIEEFIKYNEKQIEEYEKLKAKNPIDEEGKNKLIALEKEAMLAKESIVQLNQDREVVKFRLDNKIDYDLNNWKNNSVKTIENTMQELRIKLMSEKEYSSTATQQGYSMTYDEYVKNYNEKNNERINKIKEIWYGLQNNIPDLNDIKDARSVLDSTYEIYIILAIIMIIIIGGGIVATEFSKGTIRLLLIRPVSRWKILLSKLLAVFVVGFSIVILGIGILYISTGVIFGMETYKTPLLETINGSIVQVDYIKILINKILLSSTTLIFISTLVFMISTLAKNTALAVAISMVLYLGTAPITDLLISMKQTWIINTLFPYINASYFRLVPMTEQALSQNFGLKMNYTIGAVQLLIVSLVMLVITFLVFVKKDVKN